MELETLADAKLVLLAQDGNRAAFGELYARHAALVKGIIQRVNQAECDDIAQETFLVAFLTIRRLRKPESFTSWLWGITMNVCRQRWRSQKRMNNYQHRFFFAEGMPDRSFSPYALTETGEHVAMVRRAMERLSKKLRTSALLFYFEYLPIREIAKLQNITESAVKTRLHRARNSLRSMLVPTKGGLKKEQQMTQVEILDVLGEEQVIFVDRKGRRAFSVYMDKQQAFSIVVSIGKLHPPRPMTFAFFAEVLRQANVQVAHVLITELKEGTFYAVVKLHDGTEIDARPSDAVNLALTLELPIYADETVFEKIGIDLPIDDGTEIEFDPKGIRTILDYIRKSHLTQTSKDELKEYIMSIQKK